RLHVVGDGLFTGNLTSGNAVNATTEFRLNGSQILSSPGPASLSVGFNAGLNAAGNWNTFVGTDAGRATANQIGNVDTALGYKTAFTANINNATAIGAYASVSQTNSLVLGPILGQNGCTGGNLCDSVNVGIGTSAPAYRL